MDDLTTDGEPQPGAFQLGGQRVANLAESLEDRLGLSGRDSGSRVLHLDERQAPCGKARIQTCHPGGVNLAAFESRLVRTRRTALPWLLGKNHLLGDCE